MSIIISNSMVDTFNTCPKKFHYGFMMGIRKRAQSEALSYGILGHKAIEAFYETLKAGGNRQDAKAAGLQVCVRHIQSNWETEFFGEETDIAAVVGERFTRYCDFWEDDGWRVLETEKTYFSREIVPGVDYAMTCDLLVEATSGPFRGEVLVVDHKWCYNFWSDIEVEMHPQLPKYIDTLRANGYPVKRGILNQIRFRQLKDKYPPAPQILQRIPIKPPESMIKEVRREERMAVLEIQELTRHGTAISAKMVRRKMQRRVCKECSYNLICKMELYGQDPSATIVANYEPNTYGYEGKQENGNGS